MPVVYHCPHCRQPVTVSDEMLGQVLGCPHCRGAFQTFPPQPPVAAPPPPPPPPTPAEVFSLDDAEREDDEDARPRRGRYQGGSRSKRDQQKVPLSAQLAVICAAIGAVVVTVVYRTNPRPEQGFDFKQVAVSALVGGVCAGLGFLIGKLIEGGSATGQPRRRRYGRRNDDDDD
jgi:hypothetical protein